MTRPRRTALRWQRRVDPQDAYWDEIFLPDGIVECDQIHDGAPEGEDTAFAEISYPRLYHVVACLARRLHVLIAELIKKDDSAKQVLNNSGDVTPVSIPVAVAIPEGLYLPLVVSTLHALLDSIQFSTVLVPLDPAEGGERLQCMLCDARPLLVLVAAHCDLQKMQQLTTAATLAPSELYHVFPGSQPLYLASRSHVVDVRTLVKECLLESNVEKACSAWNETGLKSALQSSFRARVQTYVEPMTLNGSEYSFWQTTEDSPNCISHIVYTSGTTGVPKGCISSRKALDAYLHTKNKMHCISDAAVVLLASTVSFDPCFSDILATFHAEATLFVTSREDLASRLRETLSNGRVSHVLCTPTLWSTLAMHNASPSMFPHLQVIALGGEHIPSLTIRQWARKNPQDESTICRLYATYGVTEACVYQTLGEVFTEADLNAGVVFDGMTISIRPEQQEDGTIIATSESEIGEIVLHGRQLDEYSSYLGRPELSETKFCFDSQSGGYCYHTGDKGVIDCCTGTLQIMGRIDGETGMIKYNGIRIELGEVESAIIDSKFVQAPVVVDCMVLPQMENDEGAASTVKSLYAYIVLSRQCLAELGIHEKVPDSGILCSGSLLALLVARCTRRTRVKPSVFLLIPAIPLARTGKRNKSAVPSLKDAVSLSGVLQFKDGEEKEVPLADYSPLGAYVAEQIDDCLNLLPCQHSLLTTSSTFLMLGGDSLTATRVVRALYAKHYDIFNGRTLGGAHGLLDDDIFSVKHLLRARNLGEYVDFLHSKNVCDNVSSITKVCSVSPVKDSKPHGESSLYDVLVQTIMQSKITLALALLEAGAMANLENKHKFRLSNTRGLQERKSIFHTTPLHLACLNGEPLVVRALLERGAKFNIPDAAGMFPLHLATSGTHGQEYNEEEDGRRLACIKLLLNAGAPLPMKDGNKQTVLHWGARFGYKQILEYLIGRWKKELVASDPKKFKDSLDWRDRWSRTVVHWAVLNGRIEALKVLLAAGCRATPVKPRKNARTSAALETPQEMCDRIYGDSQMGSEVTMLLKNALS